jgi:CBS domain-containing protein
LIEAGPPNVILLRENATEITACGTFDYNDLNAYLLVVVGLAHPDEDQLELFSALAKKTREGSQIPLRDIQDLAKKAPLVTLSENEDLSKAIEIFGSGVHRILVCRHGTTEVVGILSQLKLVQFLWDNGKSFPSIDQLYPMILRDLNIGTVQTISIK